MDGEVYTDVLISGAGPSGLTLAIDLARRVARNRLLELRHRPRYEAYLRRVGLDFSAQ